MQINLAILVIHRLEASQHRSRTTALTASVVRANGSAADSFAYLVKAKLSLCWLSSNLWMISSRILQFALCNGRRGLDYATRSIVLNFSLYGRIIPEQVSLGFIYLSPRDLYLH